MKAKFKKIVAALLSAMMVLTMCVTTNVHAEGTGVIKVTSTSYTLTPSDYEAYRLFNVTKVGENYGYTSISKTITDAVADAVNTAAKPASAVEKNANEDITANNIVEYLTNNGNATFMIKFSKALEANKVSFEKTKTADAQQDGKGIQFTGLDNGYYVVIDNNATDDEPKAAAMVKVVAGDTPVEIVVKADLPTVEKKVVTDAAKPSFAIGDSITFELTGTTPKNSVLDTYEEYTYTFTDTLSKGLTIEQPTPADFAVTVDNTPYEKANMVVAPAKDGKTTLTVTFNLKETDIQEIFKDEVGKHTIKVTYSAKLNKDAVLGNAGNPNDVLLEYSNNPTKTDSKGKTEDKVKVYTFGIDITKKAENAEGNTLAGAEFELYSDPDCQNILHFDDAGKFVAEGTEGTKTTLVSDSKGKIIVKGLKEGTYYLKETKAPDGYNLLTEIKEIVINPSYETDLTYKNQQNLTNLESGLVAIEVINHAGLVLPSTGGMGTTILYLVGILAMAGGVCYFVMEKRRKAQVK